MQEELGGREEQEGQRGLWAQGGPKVQEEQVEREAGQERKGLRG